MSQSDLIYPFPKIICKNCQKEFTVIDCRKNIAKFCCVECANEYRRKNKKLNCTCTTCGKKFYMEPYQMKRYDRNFSIRFTKFTPFDWWL